MMSNLLEWESAKPAFMSIGKQFADELIGFAVEDDDVHRHFIFEKKAADGVNRSRGAFHIFVMSFLTI